MVPPEPQYKSIDLISKISLKMQFAIVFFRRSETAGVVPRADVEGEFKLKAIIKARWEGLSYSAKILFIGSKRLCEAKVDYVTTSGEIIDDDFEVSQPLEDSPSRDSSNSSPSRGEHSPMEQFREEVISRMNTLQNRMVAPSFEYNVRSELQTLKREDLQFHFVRREQVEMIRKQKKCNKNLFALALEKEVYSDLKSDLVIPVESRNSTDRVEFIKEALFKYYLVPEKCQVEVWRSARDAINSRVRRTRKQRREGGDMGSSEGSSNGFSSNRREEFRSDRSIFDIFEDDIFD